MGEVGLAFMRPHPVPLLIGEGMYANYFAPLSLPLLGEGEDGVCFSSINAQATLYNVACLKLWFAFIKVFAT